MLLTVIGAGNSGLAMSAHIAADGHEVRLWNRSEQTIDILMDTKLAHLSGVLNTDATLAMVTTDIKEAILGSKLILITTPASSHRELAYLMAPYLEVGCDIVLNPGRTFGAIEFYSVIQKLRPGFICTVAETQTIIYTCRKIGPSSVNVLALKSGVQIATFDPVDTKALISRLPRCIQAYLIPAKSMIETSLGNVGMILHCLPFVINISRVESGHPFKYYIDGITPSVAKLLEKADSERLAVGRRLGVELESCKTWMKRTYNLEGDDLYSVIQANEAYATIDAPANMVHRYIFEDIPCGLVPLEVAGHLLDVATPVVTMILDFATHLLDQDFRLEGRNLEFLQTTVDPSLDFKRYLLHEEVQ